MKQAAPHCHAERSEASLERSLKIAHATTLGSVQQNRSGQRPLRRSEDWQAALRSDLGITSLSAEQASPAQLLRTLQSYWQIENGLHYRRDVTLHEDRTRFKKHSAAHNMAIINNIVLTLIAKAN